MTSSYESVNGLYPTEFLPAFITSNEPDTNLDGLKDSLDLSISLNGIPQNEIVRNVKLLLLFNTSLSVIIKLF
jgi:hypothetical protein